MAIPASLQIQGMIQEAVVGYTGKKDSAADIVAHYMPVNFHKGLIPVRNYGTPQIGVNEQLQEGIGSHPQDLEAYLGQFSFIGSYWQQRIDMDDAERIHDEAIASGETAAKIELPRIYVTTKMDLSLRRQLVSATLNETQAAGSGNWTAANSTPIADIRAGRAKSPMANSVILSSDVADALASHPDVVGQATTAGTTVLPFAGVRDFVARVAQVPVANVTILDEDTPRLYSPTEKGVTMAIRPVYRGLFWIGVREHLVLIEQNHVGERAGNTSYQRQHHVEEYAYWRFGQIRRITGVIDESGALDSSLKNSGVILTGIAASQDT